MSDSGDSIRGPHDSDLDWALRLQRAVNEQRAMFDLSLSQGMPEAVGEIRDATMDTTRFSAGFIDPYADETLPVMPNLDSARALAEQHQAAVMAGDPQAVAQELSFGLTLHIIDVTVASGHIIENQPRN